MTIYYYTFMRVKTNKRLGGAVMSETVVAQKHMKKGLLRKRERQHWKPLLTRE